MSLRRREVELCVERPLGPERSGGTVRLSARFEVAEGGEGPAPADLARELDRLTEELDALVGPPITAAPLGRPDRDLTELVETYRPRQRDLVDLLLADGELTPSEHARLIAYLGPGREPRAPTSGTRPVAESDRLIATVPIDRPTPTPAAPASPGRTLESARPVAELLKTYQIASLRQAGAVRGRRQISFDEYMALKRHFEEEETPSSPRTSGAPG
ncbi:MAG: hypothetical protein ABSB97_02235 [Thermoplasmata archaeon]